MLIEDSKETPIKSALLAKNKLAFPATLFCSWIKVLTPSLLSAYITGTVIYPPTPITTSGLNSLIVFLHSLIPFKRHDKVLKFLSIFFVCFAAMVILMGFQSESHSVS